MKLALITALGSLAAAMAVEDGTPQISSVGTAKNFDFHDLLAQVAVREDDESLPSYCAMPPPNPACYEDSYPACCFDEAGACPEDQPDCECDGDCDAVTTCEYPNDDECEDGEFCHITIGACRQRSATVAGECREMPQACPSSEAPVCGCDNEVYANYCTASNNGVNVIKMGSCNVRGRPQAPPGNDYCTYAPDYDCFDGGWPKCCLDEDQECPSSQPRCDSNKQAEGWDYCTWEGDDSCYLSGWPACCDRFDGTNCPSHHPNCDAQVA